MIELREDYELLGELEWFWGDGFICLLFVVNKFVISYWVYIFSECLFIKFFFEWWGLRIVYWVGCWGVKESFKLYWDKMYVRWFERFKSISKKKY